MTNIIMSSILFQGIDEKEVTEIIKESKARKVEYEKNSFVFIAGVSKPEMGIMLEGEAQVIKESFSGESMIIESLKKGDLFGETYACLGTESIPVSVRTICASTCFMIDIENIIRIGTGHPQLMRNLLRMISEKNVMLNTKMFYITHKSIRSRLEAYLYDQAEKQKSAEFTIPYNRNELADYLCTDRSALSRELSKMKKEGLIEYERDHFTLKAFQH